MTYGVFTLLFGVVIFLAYKFVPKKFKRSSPQEETLRDSKNNTSQNPKHGDSLDELAEWVLKVEKSKSELKEKLCRAPVPSRSEILFGREEVLTDVLRAITKGKSIFEFYGRAGVGKTTLALKVVQKYKYDFQNIKLYLDFSGEGKNALSTKDAMIQVVLAFQPTVQIPETLPQLNRLYQHIMESRQGVLVLDNVSSAKQVQELKPTGSCSWLIIVTAEKSLTLADTYSVKIGPLDVEAAQKFLIDCSLRLRPRAREIAKLCRGLPLALEMCGHFLSSNFKVHPEEFVNLFRKHRNNSLLQKNDEFEESLLAAFKAIYYSLSAKEQNAFNQLAIFPKSFDSTAYIQVCQEHKDCLKSLSQFGLVKSNLITKRYLLPEWIKNQLKNYLPLAVAREARQRHATYYLSILNGARENILKGGEKAREGYQLFHREWANILTGLNWVRKNSVEGKKAAELFNLYVVAISDLLPLHFFPKECRSFLEAGLKISQRLSTENIEAQHLLNLGAFHSAQKKYEEAGECFVQAEQITTTLEDAKIAGKVFNEMARLSLTTNKPEEAIDILLKKEKLCQKNKIEVDEEISLMQLGLAYEKKGEFNKAIRSMQEGQRRAKESQNGPCMATLLKHLGFCLGEVKDFSTAEDYFEAALKLARGLGNKAEEIEIHLRFGKIYAKSEDLERAFNLFSEGLELAEVYRNSRYEGLILMAMGDTYTLMQEKQKAVESYMKAMGPLKKARELVLVDKINQRLSQSFELPDGKVEPSEPERVVKPIHRLSQVKGISLVQAKTNDFIHRGDNKMIAYYIGSIEEIIKNYNLDINEAQTRESLEGLVGSLRESNHHACATIFKNKFSL